MGALEYLRKCIICGLGFGRIRLFCSDCESTFQSFRPQPIVESSRFGHRIFSLIEWNSRSDLFVSSLIHALKGNHSQRAFRKLGGILAWGLMERYGRFPFDLESILVPCPPRSKDRLHANHLATAVSHELGVTLEAPLVLGPSGALQKMKTAPERLKLVMTSKAKQFQPVIFIDDVVTTGATLKAAYEALRPQGPFTVVCIACRN